MHNRFCIIYILIANILWSFIPVTIYGLFDEVSIIMIIFLRFLVSGLVLFALALIILYLNNKHSSKVRISLKQLLEFMLNKNREFFNLRNIVYISLLGFFGIILHIIAYFMSLKTTTIAFTMIGFQISIILVAFYEHGVKSEKLDFFKILYLIILIFSVGIIIIVYLEGSPINPGVGFFYVILFAVCVSFLHIGINKDSYSEKEIKLINKTENYKMARLLLKLSLIFLTGIILMLPFLLIISVLPFQGDLTEEITLFYSQIPVTFSILIRWEIIFLIVFATLIPFLLLFLASVKWSSFNLTYSQWSSILTIIEPIGGILFGVLFGIEVFPLDFLIIVLFLLTMSILLRYAHESKNKVNAYILLSKEPGKGLVRELPVKLLKFHGVSCVQSLIGNYDILLNIKTNSIKDVYYLIDTKIRKLDGIKSIKILFINKIHKLEN